MTPAHPFSPVADPWATRSASRHAFTLIELLTVIAIIGILAGILILSMGKMRASARKSQCLSSLRQIHTVVMLYSNENRKMLPLTMDRTANKNWWENGSPLAAYTGGLLTLQRLSVCGENETEQPIPSTDSYGKWVKNQYGYPYAANYQVMPDGMTGVNMNRIPTPSQVILMTDSASGSDWGPGLYLTEIESGHLSRIGVQHGSRSNALWVDGHVTFSDKTDIQKHCVIR